MRKGIVGLSLAPTDLSNFSSCHHLVSLDFRAAIGELERPVRHGAFVDALRQRGNAHEAAYLSHLRARGFAIEEINEAHSDHSSLLEATKRALSSGADVIYQAVLSNDRWSGRADFLLKVDVPSDLGGWSYEVVDTKLAKETRVGTILQLCAYTKLLESIQGVRPECIHVVSPGRNFEPQSFRLAEYSAYFRLLERGILEFIAGNSPTYPELVAHCDYCAWWRRCEMQRRADDQLCYVAGISGSQIRTLRSLNIHTLEGLARLDPVPIPEKGSVEALTRVRDQARAQLTAREQEEPYYVLHEPLDKDHGLALLPEPTPDDIFLDFEGSRFAEGGVKEYLTGYISTEEEGRRTYHALWASNPSEERIAFEKFVDTAIAARQKNPNAHIYHFAHYEKTALQQLMGRHATRETELDALLHGKAFVDLYRVVKNALFAGIERYSIKDLEPFLGFSRSQNLREANWSRRLIERALEVGDLDLSLEDAKAAVEAYNREDCESTIRLRDWLESLRTEQIAAGADLPRPHIDDKKEASDKVKELDRRLRDLRDALLNGVPAEASERTEEQQAKFLLAHMLEFHRREDKASWWEYFRIRGLDLEDWYEERRAAVGIEHIETIEAKRAPLEKYRFAVQEIDVRRGDKVYGADEDHAMGEVVDVNYTERTVSIKKTQKTAQVHPSSVFFHNRVPSEPLRNSLMRLAETVLSRGLKSEAPYRAGLALLLRRPSPLAGRNGRLQASNETTVQAACRIAKNLDGHVLAIQGPPGTGKTYTGKHIICELKRSGLKVGVTAVSHKVIENLLEGAAEEAKRQGLPLSVVHRKEGEYEGQFGLRREYSYDKILAGLGSGDIDVVGATQWAWAREDFEQVVDVLVVDEAGQMSLSNVLAACPGAKGLVLLGDPQQLEQPLQCSHPEGSEVSALFHLLDGGLTMPVNKGLFLDETYRLHPDIARFTSEVYYEGRVTARDNLKHQTILSNSKSPEGLTGSGLRYMLVAHHGNSSRAPEEVEAISDLVQHLLGECQWRNKNEHESRITTNDILIVAPYNRQVAALTEAMPAMHGRIGTVDKFQGQQAAVVIYSMTSSSPEDAPHGMDFLYDRHRFNVATSRAKVMCILAGNPALFEPECKTLGQVRRANLFCRYLELAEPIVN